MDIRCRICAEPYDIEHLHDVVHSENLEQADGKPHTFDTLFAAFSRVGCLALGEPQCHVRSLACEAPEQEERRLIYELLGDDVDGIAAAFEDMYE